MIGEQKTKALNIALWIVQVFLLVLFGMAGVMKSTLPLEQLAQNVPWSRDMPLPLVRFIGVAELAGALGMVLPSLTRVAPVLTPVAGAALALVMSLATGFHIMRGEYGVIAFPLVLGALAAFVAWGRRVRVPIAPRA